MVTLFGEDYSINTCLAYALQFSHLRAKEQLQAQRDLLSKDMLDIKKYIDKYKTDLPQEIYDSQEYSIKLLQIPKISNTNRHDLAVEFVHWNSLSEEDRANYQRISTIIKDKIVVQRVSNANLLKPSAVIRSVEDKTGVKLSQSDHTLLWKSFRASVLQHRRSINSIPYQNSVFMTSHTMTTCILTHGLHSLLACLKSMVLRKKIFAPTAYRS